MARKTELTLAKQFALLVQYGKAHGISTAANDIARDTGMSAANIQRILNGEKANPSLRIGGYYQPFWSRVELF